MNPSTEKWRTRSLTFRWSYFLFGVILIAITLLMMLRSDDEGWEVLVYYSASTSPAGTFLRGCSLQSSYGQVGIHSAYGVHGPGTAAGPPIPRFKATRMIPNPEVPDWPVSLSYRWVIALECVLLFFLVPSAFDRRRQNRSNDD